MEKNPDYWGGNPKVGPFLDRIVIKPVSDASARVAGLRGGSFDMIIVPSPDTKDLLNSKDSSGRRASAIITGTGLTT